MLDEIQEGDAAFLGFFPAPAVFAVCRRRLSDQHHDEFRGLPVADDDRIVHEPAFAAQFLRGYVLTHFVLREFVRQDFKDAFPAGHSVFGFGVIGLHSLLFRLAGLIRFLRFGLEFVDRFLQLVGMFVDRFLQGIE